MEACRRGGKGKGEGEERREEEEEEGGREEEEEEGRTIGRPHTSSIIWSGMDGGTIYQAGRQAGQNHMFCLIISKPCTIL